jgi:hypothetical protein
MFCRVVHTYPENANVPIYRNPRDGSTLQCIAFIGKEIELFMIRSIVFSSCMVLAVAQVSRAQQVVKQPREHQQITLPTTVPKNCIAITGVLGPEVILSKDLLNDLALGKTASVKFDPDFVDTVVDRAKAILSAAKGKPDQFGCSTVEQGGDSDYLVAELIRTGSAAIWNPQSKKMSTEATYEKTGCSDRFPAGYLTITANEGGPVFYLRACYV